MAATSSLAAPRGVEFSRNQILRYIAAVAGLLALVSFYVPWVRADLTSIGSTSLTGLELARGDAASRVDVAVFGVSARAVGAAGTPAAGAGSGASAGAGSAAGAGSLGGLTLPTRQPTSAAGSQGASQVIGGLTLPTRQPTAAAASAGASQLLSAPPAAAQGSPTVGIATATPIVNAALSGGVPIEAAVLAPEPPAPETLPKVSLYLVPFLGLGIVGFSLIWHRLTDVRDRRAGKAWTLILSVGGAAWVGYVLARVLTAPVGNSLIAPGLGGVTGAEPGLWLAFAGFLVAAVCLILAWLSPTPPPPDPYWRVRASRATA